MALACFRTLAALMAPENAVDVFEGVERCLDRLEERFRRIEDGLRNYVKTHMRKQEASHTPELCHDCTVVADLETGALLTEGDHTPTLQLLIESLKALSFSYARFIRVPADYYDKDLEYRRQCLGRHQ